MTSKAPVEVRQYVRKRDQYRCQNDDCRRICTDHPDIEHHVHHITPVSWGGSHDPENLITVCNVCHRRLHQKEDSVEDGRLGTDLIGETHPLRYLHWRNEKKEFRGCRKDIVELLAERGSATLSELSEETGYSKSHIIHSKDLLLSAGYVKRPERGVYAYVTKEEVEQNKRAAENDSESMASND